MTTEVQIDELPEAAPLEQSEELPKVASDLHGVLGLRLGRHLGNYVDVEGNQLGWVFNSTTTFRVKGTPPTRQPDVAFVSLEKMPRLLDDEVPFAPDLAVEVVSKNDTDYEIEKKVLQYQQSGVRLIWIVHPISQTVSIYRLNSGFTPQSLNSTGELDGESVIPGFKLKVGTLFV